MGLDTVELVMDIEKAFNISIPDPQAETMVTVGDFHRVVCSHLKKEQSDRCNSQALFYTLRRSAGQTFGIPKQAFNLSAPVNTLFPYQNRRQVYRDFATVNQLELPPLVLSKLRARFLDIACVTIVTGGFALSIILVNIFSFSKWIFFLPVAGVFLIMGISSLLNPLRTVIGHRHFLVKDFVQNVLVLNYGKLIKDTGARQQEVLILVNHIIADKTGLPLEDITPEKRICDDLGLD